MQGEGCILQGPDGIWDPFSIEDLVARGALDQLDAITAIAAGAAREAGIEKTLTGMKTAWDGLAFLVLPYKDTGTCIIGGVDDIQVGT